VTRRFLPLSLVLAPTFKSSLSGFSPPPLPLFVHLTDYLPLCSSPLLPSPRHPFRLAFTLLQDFAKLIARTHASGGMLDLGENGDDEDEDVDGEPFFSFPCPLPFGPRSFPLDSTRSVLTSAC
jgi:hypothetical protein